ncbi:hypothetical protein F945_01920 [Acinetobacter rudis CIP 110305]|uniref:Uncharacterized protein n=1 Tax=Acinetobacter rudis CIP 110305 TaxID=421052 RepID=S3P4M2_9GAMM|nr:hypothetical protein F945_01920 [Acinetobacter rudis CIP 110305]
MNFVNTIYVKIINQMCELGVFHESVKYECYKINILNTPRC